MLRLAIDTTPASRQETVAWERAEARAWHDLYSAAPAAWAADVGLEARMTDDGVVLSWAATQRRYFSRAIGLGVLTPARAEVVDEVIDAWRRAGIDAFLLQSIPHCRPDDFVERLEAHGLEPFDRQDRVVRRVDASVVPIARDRDLRVEKVTRRTVDEWVAFLESVYGLDTGPWLPHLIGRRGWYQYIAREDGRIVGARGAYVGLDGIAWLGMDGPVPGLATQDYEPDAAILAAIVGEAGAIGARSFIADIEAPSDELDTPAYDTFAGLGFVRPYLRTHHARL